MADSPDGSSTRSPGVGPYELLGELGRGGMGIVYRARHRETGGEHAVKVLVGRPGGSGSSGDRASLRFRREIDALVRLDGHPGIVRIMGAGSTERGAPWFAMELIEGASLAARIERTGPLDPAEAARLVAAVARAVAHAHRAGIVHRDLKPENVLIDEATGAPRVVDFGVALLVDDEGARLTATGAIVGSIAFMAPEQVDPDVRSSERARPPVGPPADVYGLGGILFACLVGEPPFAGANVMAVLRAILKDPPPSPRARRREVPEELAAVCRRALAKQPGDRYASADALAADLERFGRGEPVAAATGAVRLRTTLRARRGRIAGAGLGLLALAAIVAGLVRRAAPAATPPIETLRRLEALADRGRLDDASVRADLRALARPAARATLGPELVRRADAIGALLELSEAPAADPPPDAIARLQEALRPERRLDGDLLARVETTLAAADRIEALAAVIFGAEPQAPPSPWVAPRLVRALAEQTAAADALPFPIDEAAFSPLAAVGGTDRAVLTRLLRRRARAAAARGADGDALTGLRALVGAHRLGWVPVEPIPARVRAAAAEEAWAALEADDLERAWPILDLIARDVGPEQAAPVAYLAIVWSRLRDDIDLASRGDRGASGLDPRERALAYLVYMAVHGESVPLPDYMRMVAHGALGLEWMSSRIEAELSRPPHQRNPAVVLFLGGLAAETDRSGDEMRALRERIAQWTREAAAVGPDRRWLHHAAARTLHLVKHDDDAREHAHRALQHDRELPGEERWPEVAALNARLVKYPLVDGRRRLDARTAQLQASLAIEAARIYRERWPHLDAIKQAAGHAASEHDDLGELLGLLRKVADRLMSTGVCCDGAGPRLEELLAALRAMGAAFATQAEPIEQKHRAHHEKR